MHRLATSTRNGFRLLLVILTAACCARPAIAQDDTQQLPVDNDPFVRIVEPQSEMRIVEKFAKIVEMKNRITTVCGFDPEVINVTKVDMHPNQIRVHALIPGVTSLVLVDEKNTTYTVEVLVTGDVRHLQTYLKNLFPNDAVTAVAVRDSVVLRGYVSRPENIPRMMDIAKEFYPNVLNQMEVGGDQEIQLKVRVVEVDRTKLRQLGFNFIDLSSNSFLASAPGALSPLATLSAPFGGPPDLEVDPTKFTTQPSFIGGFVNNSHVFSGFLNALLEESLLKILANPVLTTTNGQPANMLSGGEFPILVPQSLGTVTVQWKEYGVRLTAVPMLLGDGRVRLYLQPEVSQKDLSNSVTTGGITVPALTTRRVNTAVEMRFGETFMLAGLIEVQDTAQTFKVPWLGELPYVGAMFRTVSHQAVETELCILVTPVLSGAMTECQTPPGGPGMFSDDPTDRELYINGMIEVPSYGDHCPPGGCCPSGYPPPIIDFDMQHQGGSVMPVPVQTITTPIVPTAPGPATGAAPMPPGSPIQMMPQQPTPAGPATQMPPAPGNGGPVMDNLSSSYWRNPPVRQASNQSSQFGAPPATQAGYTTAVPGSISPPAPAGRGTAQSQYGLYEPQSGLYVPSGSGSP
jgi:pilus assembly protein CpaC